VYTTTLNGSTDRGPESVKDNVLHMDVEYSYGENSNQEKVLPIKKATIQATKSPTKNNMDAYSNRKKLEMK
jgi:RAB protein geranylgeranyltransferase component A